MERELVLKKCLKCGALVNVIKDCKCESGCGIKCCGETMKVIVPNTEEAAFEKHVPTYEISGEEIKVKVNHVMEDEHYIEWISMVTENEEIKKFFKPGEIAECTFRYVKGAKLYSYCNKHSLWMSEVK